MSIKNSLLALTICTLLPFAQARAQEVLSVQVKETKLRSAPKHWASGVVSLKYGDSVYPIKVQEDWVEGSSASKAKGFVHISALSSKKVVLSSKGGVDVGVAATDVLLAGKGFSKATEEEYSRQQGKSDFKAVNSVEAVKVTDSEILAFMREGSIGQGGK